MEGPNKIVAKPGVSCIAALRREVHKRHEINYWGWVAWFWWKIAQPSIIFFLRLYSHGDIKRMSCDLLPTGMFKSTTLLGKSVVWSKFDSIILSRIFWLIHLRHLYSLHNEQACKLKFRLRMLISLFCCDQTSHAALIAEHLGSSWTWTGNELSQPTFEFSSLTLKVTEC